MPSTSADIKSGWLNVIMQFLEKKGIESIVHYVTQGLFSKKPQDTFALELRGKVITHFIFHSTTTTTRGETHQVKKMPTVSYYDFSQSFPFP